MVVLRLMGACNNKCRFCMVKDEIRQSSHVPLEKLVRMIEGLKHGDFVDLFGGEPTLYPYFWELMDVLKRKEFNIGVASNARTMKSLDFVERLKTYPNVKVRTSLYGHTDHIHDYYTGVKGSFEETIAGIANLCDNGLHPPVNIVILPKNFKHLLEMVKNLSHLGVTSIKFSSVFGKDRIKQYLVDYSEVKPSLKEAISLSKQHDIDVKIEKSPLCLAPENVNHFIPETDPRMKPGLPKYYMYSKTCEQCALKKACNGILKSYYEVFEENGITSFQDIPAYAVRQIAFASLSHYRPQTPTEFLALKSNNDCSEKEDLTEMVRFLLRIKADGLSCYVVKGEALYP